MVDPSPISTAPATVAPAAGTPLATSPTGSAPPSSGGGFLDTIKNMFVDSSGKMKLGTVLATVLLGGLGAYMGSGSGLLGMLGFGAAGAIGGSLLGPMLQGLLDNLMGTTPAASFSRSPQVQASPDTVIRTQQPILQAGAPTVTTTLVTPNLDRFAALNSENASLLTNLEN